MEVKYINKAGEEKVYKYDTKEYSKKNRLKNDDKLKIKYPCQCNGSYSITTKQNHFKTKTHIHYMNTIEEKIIDDIIKEDQPKQNNIIFCPCGKEYNEINKNDHLKISLF